MKVTVNGGAEQTYTYENDSAQHLSSLAGPSGKTEFTYYPGGQRMQKLVNLREFLHHYYVKYWWDKEDLI